MSEVALRVAWASAVVGAFLAHARGLALTTYFQLTPQAHAEAERGRVWLWVATVALLIAAAAAARRWLVPPWSLAALAVAGPVGLVADDLGWIPPVALIVSVPLLLIGLAGAVPAPRRIPPVISAAGPASRQP